jgi:hypothetical protein
MALRVLTTPCQAIAASKAEIDRDVDVALVKPFEGSIATEELAGKAEGSAFSRAS